MTLDNIQKLLEPKRMRPAFDYEESKKLLPKWPKPLAHEAFYGLAGGVVRRIEPHTESDPAALLVQFLCAFGNIIGRNSHFQIEADKHFGNLFVILAGESAKGRKGTSWGQVSKLFEQVDPVWKQNCVRSGLASGEGLLWAVRDPIEKQQPKKECPDQFETVVVDPGVSDKRLLTIESEFAAVLKALEREGNKLSAMIRDAWDRGELSSLTKSATAKASNAHISICGHITKTELLRYLSMTETANGFGNRFLWVCVKRSKLLPEGGRQPDMTNEINQLRDAVDFGRRAHSLSFDPAARSMWIELYEDLSKESPGLLGAMTARAEPQILRLASIYALLDRASLVSLSHLQAAVAVWDYCEASCAYLFGGQTGDKTADKILEALVICPEGMTQTEIHEQVFNRHAKASDMARALETLERFGLIQKKSEPGQGRTASRWFASSNELANSELSEESETCADAEPDNSHNSHNSRFAEEWSWGG